MVIFVSKGTVWVYAGRGIIPPVAVSGLKSA
jgi:hypothetical protein